MEVVYYKRVEKGANGNTFVEDRFYIPDENVVLYKQQQGSFNGQDYFYTDEQKSLSEGLLVRENIPIEGAEIENRQIFDINAEELKQLIKDIKAKPELETRITKGMAELYQQVNITSY